MALNPSRSAVGLEDLGSVVNTIIIVMQQLSSKEIVVYIRVIESLTFESSKWPQHHKYPKPKNQPRLRCLHLAAPPSWSLCELSHALLDVKGGFQWIVVNDIGYLPLMAGFLFVRYFGSQLLEISGALVCHWISSSDTSLSWHQTSLLNVTIQALNFLSFQKHCTTRCLFSRLASAANGNPRRQVTRTRR